jgi:antitoxin Phd
MKTASATEVKNKLGQFFDAALAEPVIVEKSGRPSVVILSYSEYERLQAMEDAYWGARAQAAEHTGWVGPEEVLNRIRDRLDAET